MNMCYYDVLSPDSQVRHRQQMAPLLVKASDQVDREVGMLLLQRLSGSEVRPRNEGLELFLVYVGGLQEGEPARAGADGGVSG